MMPKDKDQLPSAECWGVAGDRRASVLVFFLLKDPTVQRPTTVFRPKVE